MKNAVFLAFILLLSGTCTGSGKMTIHETVHSALLNNEQVVIAASRVEASRARVSQAFSGYLPSLSLSANYSKSFSSPIISEFKIGDIDTPVTFGFNEPYESRSWQAALTQNIFTFGKLEGRLAAALESVRAAEEEYRKARQDVIYSAVSAYFDVIRSELAVRYAERAHESARKHFDRVRMMKNRGRLSESELLRAQVALLSAEQSLLKARTAERLALAGLSSTTGLTAQGAYILSEKDLSLFLRADKRAYDEITREAYEHNPELRRAQSAVRISENNLFSAKAGWLPSISAQGTYGWNNTDYSGSAIDFDQTNWSVAAGASWTLFDGFGSASRIKEAAVSLEEAKASYSAVSKAAALELERAYLGHVSAVQVREIASQALVSAKKAMDAEEIRFAHGLASNIEVLDAQASLAKAELDLLSADFELCISYLSLKKSAGTLDEHIFSGQKEDGIR